MKTLTLLLFLFYPFVDHPAEILETSSTTWAVVIGISNYQDPDIPDLQFANRDAQIFADYLTADIGGGIPQEQVTLLVDEDATMAKIYGAIDMLLDNCSPADKAILYFSGHSDIEQQTVHQRRFLLAWDTPANHYRVGGISVAILQDILSTLSINGVEVVFIADACRNSELTTSKDGATAPNPTFVRQFNNEVKILSCQPNEVSVEGSQWGGGHGVFTHYLIQGLWGAADLNDDDAVTLFELSRYLEDVVYNDTSPQFQIPMVIGQRSTILSFVRKDTDKY